MDLLIEHSQLSTVNPIIIRLCRALHNVTMSSRETNYTHIVNVWLDAANNRDTPIALALRRGNHTTSRKLDGLVRTPGPIDTLRYVLPGETDERELNDEEKEELHAIIPYRNFLQNECGRSDHVSVDITTKDRDDFLDYIGLVYDHNNPTQYDPEWALRSELARAHPSSTSSSGTSIPTTISSPSTSLQQWDKGIKRDPSLFPKLKNNYQWNGFRLQFTAVAKAQRVDKVLDPTYSPAPGTEEEALLYRMKEFIYSILLTNIETTKGEAIVKQHEDDMDAQEVWKLLVAHYTDSIAASKRADVLFATITTSRMKEIRNKPLEVCITNFRSTVQEYNKLADDPMSESTELTHLKNFVSTIPDLNNVTTTANIWKRLHGTALDPSTYMDLYEAQAAEIDAQDRAKFIARGGRAQSARYEQLRASTHEGEYDDDEYDVDYDDFEHEDPFEVNMSNRNAPYVHPLARQQRGPSRPMLGKSTWLSLSKEGREIWDKLSDRDKTHIVMSRRPPPRRDAANEYAEQQLARDEPPPSSSRSTNVCETNGDNSQDQSLEINSTICSTLLDALQAPKIEANQTSRLPPYDVRRLLSQESSKKYGEKESTSSSKHGELMNGEMKIKKKSLPKSSSLKATITDKFSNRISSNHRTLQIRMPVICRL